MALVGAFGEISQKTDSIAHAIKVIPDLKSQVEVLQTQVVSLCSEGAHTGPSPEMLGHLAEAQQARVQLLAESQRLHAANLANEKKDQGLRDIFTRINSDMAAMRDMMQTQGQGVGVQIQGELVEIRDQISENREQIIGSRDQLWAHAQTMEENIDFLSAQLDELKARVLSPLQSQAPHIQIATTHQVQAPQCILHGFKNLRVPQHSTQPKYMTKRDRLSTPGMHLNPTCQYWLVQSTP